MRQLSGTELIEFVRSRFPDTDWVDVQSRWRDRRSVDEELRTDLKPWEIQRVRELGPEGAFPLLRDRLGEKAVPLLQRMKNTGFWRAPRGLRLRREELDSFDVEERQRFLKASPVRQIIMAARKFPRVWGRRVDNLPRVLRVERPDDWDTMPVEDRVKMMADRAGGAKKLVETLNRARNQQSGRRPPRNRKER